jgi:hypothetical protein
MRVALEASFVPMYLFRVHVFRVCLSVYLGSCDVCAKKVEIDIRVCLNKLPTVLIAHLKRIVFDFDTFENKKINTR